MRLIKTDGTWTLKLILLWSVLLGGVWCGWMESRRPAPPVAVQHARRPDPPPPAWDLINARAVRDWQAQEQSPERRMQRMEAKIDRLLGGH